MDFRSSTTLSPSFFAFFLISFPNSLSTLANPPSNTLVRFSTLSQMFYSRFYNTLPMPIAHSVTIDQGSLCRVPCVVRILCMITLSTYTYRVDFSPSLSLSLSRSQHMLQSQLSSRHLCARRHDHTLRPALVQKYTFAS